MQSRLPRAQDAMEVPDLNTKGIIENAAFSLFREFPFDTITVQMILDRAEVSRKTFYKYYADKYVLMELYYRYFMDKNITENFDGSNWGEVLEKLFDFVEADRSFFLHVNETTGQGSFWNFLRGYSYDFYSSVKLHNEARDSLTEEERMAIIMIVEGQIAAFRHLIEKNVHIDNKKLAELFCSLIPPSFMEVQRTDAAYTFPTSR